MEKTKNTEFLFEGETGRHFRGVVERVSIRLVDPPAIRRGKYRADDWGTEIDINWRDHCNHYSSRVFFIPFSTVDSIAAVIELANFDFDSALDFTFNLSTAWSDRVEKGLGDQLHLGDVKNAAIIKGD